MDNLFSVMRRCILSLENVGANQQVDRYVWPRRLVGVQDSKWRLVDATKNFAVEGIGPRGFEPPLDLLWQLLEGVEQTMLQMLVVFPKHQSFSPLSVEKRRTQPNYITFRFSALTDTFLQCSQMRLVKWAAFV